MSCWAVVPLKVRRFGKTRLSGLLDEAARGALVQSMLDTVLSALSAAQEIDRIAVVSSEPERIPAGVLALPDPGEGLNPALIAAADEALYLSKSEGRNRATVSARLCGESARMPASSSDEHESRED